MGELFSSVLVANRGEIALRVIRTCARLGIGTVAVYSDADAGAPHVRAADAAVRLGPGPAADSYLRGDLVIDAALATGAGAVHPGYGFLAENAAFADAVEAAGLAWIGPPGAAMRALGDKARAKGLAEASGVPVLAGYHGEAASDDDLIRHAEDLGYPLLVKASAGGGGRGMRVVRAGGELPEGLAAARREAAASFGDDRLLLERFVERPRHVEVQVLGDVFGSLVHLGERECSVQRRHQKLIEESPSPAVTPALREAMGDAALRLARAAGYRNAGTVEFLVDGAGGFFFLEVNARLQVEHPVTEAVTGLDLVEQQLRVAAGEPLGFGQADVRLDGHAMEVRIVAEDVAAGFLPATGVVSSFEVGDGVRVDTGIETGSVITPFYDSLVAKVIANGPDRSTVIERLGTALDETVLDGVASNVDLLAAVLAEPAFLAGDLDTAFLEEHGVIEGLARVEAPVVAAAAGARSLASTPASVAGSAAGDPGVVSTASPWGQGRAWRVGGVGETLRWTTGDGVAEASTSIGEAGRTARVSIDGRVFDVRRDGGASGAASRQAIQVTVDGTPAVVRPAWGRRRVDAVTWQGRGYRLRPARPPSVDSLAPDSDEPDALSAPMPGRIVRIHVSPGDHVDATDPLLVLEAMKMEHVISAAAPGRVARLFADVGDQVARGAPLVELEAAVVGATPEGD